MGCDIHAYVEHSDKNREGKKYWSSFGGRINPGRNYELFGLLAGVRREGNPLYELRGLPDKLAFWSRDDSQLFISEDEGEGCATLDEAKRYEQGGCEIISQNGEPTWVTHPDWHSHSWLTLNEFEKVLKSYNESEVAKHYKEPEYEALLAAMGKLASFNKDVRIVFWFDN